MTPLDRFRAAIGQRLRCRVEPRSYGAMLIAEPPDGLRNWTVRDAPGDAAELWRRFEPA